MRPDSEVIEKMKSSLIRMRKIQVFLSGWCAAVAVYTGLNLAIAGTWSTIDGDVDVFSIALNLIAFAMNAACARWTWVEAWKGVIQTVTIKDEHGREVK